MQSPFDENGAQFAWNSSSITLVEECLRKYYYVMIEGWRPKVMSSHLLFGGLYAKALERFHKLIATGMGRDEALVSVVRDAMIETWTHDRDENGERIPGTGQAYDFLHNTKTRENLIRSIVWYVDHFAEDKCEIITLSDGSPAAELSFSIPVDNDLIFAGHLDRLVTYGDDQFVMDQKTSGRTITPSFFEDFKPNTQMSLYSFVGKMILSAPVRGVIIDAAQIAVGFTRFERGFTMRNEAELNEWYDDAMYHIEQARRATQEQRFPMNTSSCGNYGGCPFRHVCGQPPSVRDKFLSADFEKTGPLNPLEQR